VKRFLTYPYRRARTAFSALRRKAKEVGVCRLGATAVEFGIVFPLFLTMVLGMMEMSRAMWIKASMQHAAEITTRYYMVNNDASTTTLTTYAQAALQTAGVSYAVTYTVTLDTATTPNTLTVSGTYNFEAIVSFIPFPDVTLTALSVTRANS